MIQGRAFIDTHVDIVWFQLYCEGAVFLGSGISKSKYSFYNAVSAFCLTLVNGLLGIVVTRFVITYFGSDFNGLNSAANQIVNVLLVLEGGFTLASNVALFAPLGKQNYSQANGILSATKKRFSQIAAGFFAVGILVARIYAASARSNLPDELITAIIVMTVIPAAFNLFYAATFRVLLQARQQEYVISLMTASTIGIGHLLNIITMMLGGSMWMIRCNTMILAVVNNLLIVRYVKKRCPFVDLSVPPQWDSIRGTRDVMIQKVTGVIYGAAPIVLMTIVPTGSTALASVYAVYNNVFLVLKSLLYAITDAPRLGLGQLFTQRERRDVWPVYRTYEYFVYMVIFLLLTTAYVLILPFISIYTSGITDIDYHDPTIATLMVITTVIEVSHIPSGHVINMAGKFKIGMFIQTIGCAVLVTCMLIGEQLWGVYGLLSAVLLTAVVIALLEIGYVHFFFFKQRLWQSVHEFVPLAIIGCIVCRAESNLHLSINGYMDFIVYGILLVLANGTIALLATWIFNRTYLQDIIVYLKRMLL